MGPEIILKNALERIAVGAVSGDFPLKPASKKYLMECASKALVRYDMLVASQQAVHADASGHANGCAWKYHEAVGGKSYCKRCRHRLT